jgi:hypothetical protein
MTVVLTLLRVRIINDTNMGVPGPRAKSASDLSGSVNRQRLMIANVSAPLGTT